MWSKKKKKASKKPWKKPQCEQHQLDWNKMMPDGDAASGTTTGSVCVDPPSAGETAEM